MNRLGVITAVLALAFGCKCSKLTERGAATGSGPAGSDKQASAERCVQEYLVDDYHRVCARRRDGSYRCRGWNRDLQSTDGIWPGLPAPVSLGHDAALVAFPGEWDLLSLGANTCGTRKGRLWCWGWNVRGDILNGGPELVAKPTLMAGFLDGIVGFSHQGKFFNTLHADGSVYNKNGVHPPRQFENLPKGVKQVGTAALYTCVRTDSEVWCHGGQSFVNEAGSVTSTATLAFVGPLRLVKIEDVPADIADMTIGGGHGCVLTRSGQVWCWGGTAVGQWGNDTTADCRESCPGLDHRRAHRALVAPAREIEAAMRATCAITVGGEVWCWGAGWQPSVSTEVPIAVPKQIPDLGSDNLHVFGGTQWCVEKTDHRLICWRSNQYHQIREGTCASGDNYNCGPTEVVFDCSR